MGIRDDYDSWSGQYDSDHNKTRDLEGAALRKTLGHRRFGNTLEAGCGTGKNTGWLAQQCDHVVAADFSAGMLAVARKKSSAANVTFRETDLLNRWPFPEGEFDLIVFSLVLEHIQDLEPAFAEASRVLKPGGSVYVGELHPFKQYAGAKARFEVEGDVRLLTCYTHHVSSFYNAAFHAGLSLSGLAEHFDDESDEPPRLLTMLFEKRR